MPKQHIAAEILVSAPLEAAFDTVNDLRRFNEWNPFFKADPATQWHIEGPRVGPGATYVYSSKRAGSGRMEITSVTQPIRIEMAMTFLSPSASTAVSRFSFEPAGAQIRVRWSMDADRSFGANLLAKLIGMDRMMAKAFNSGLADLKAILEAS